MVCAVCLDRYGFLERPFFQGVFLKKNEKQTFLEAAPCGTLRLRIASFVCFQTSFRKMFSSEKHAAKI